MMRNRILIIFRFLTSLVFAHFVLVGVSINLKQAKAIPRDGLSWLRAQPPDEFKNRQMKRQSNRRINNQTIETIT